MIHDPRGTLTPQISSSVFRSLVTTGTTEYFLRLSFKHDSVQSIFSTFERSKALASSDR